jgi:ABC-type polysaccharide/polyol phosphate transport system ATPase subunit
MSQASPLFIRDEPFQASRVMLRVQDLTKTFQSWENPALSFKDLLIRLSKGDFSFTQKSPSRVVLDHISFDIYEGEFVGIMGRNGVGKSTLFKLLSGIYKPTSGTVEANGTIAPLIEIGAGFHPDLTGTENIFLNAAILGFGRKYTQNVYSKVVEFSELGEHISSPLRTYSSGMLARLGFSVAVQLSAPILLIDELLAVGDAGFQEKCLAKIRELYQQGRTIVLVTHDPTAIRNYCTRCIILDQGKKVFDGPPELGAQRYSGLFSKDLSSSSL